MADEQENQGHGQDNREDYVDYEDRQPRRDEPATARNVERNDSALITTLIVLIGVASFVIGLTVGILFHATNPIMIGLCVAAFAVVVSIVFVLLGKFRR